MFYRFARQCVHLYLFFKLGPIKIQHRDRAIMNQPYILVAQHHHAWDALVYATTLAPRPFFFMAKQALFKQPLVGWLLRRLNAFPIDRGQPNVAVLNQTVDHLKTRPESLIVFPSGSRYSSTLKSGYLVIAHNSGAPILPVAFQHQGWGRNTLVIGDAIQTDPSQPLNRKQREQATYDLNQTFTALAEELPARKSWLPVIF